MKKKQKTFAERAKAIKDKYTRAEWDATERKDMMKELKELRDEQESVREAMNIAEKSDEMDEVEKYADGGPSKVLTSNLRMPQYKDMLAASNFSKNTNPVGEQFRPIQTSATPYLVSAGLSAIGDIAGLINQKRNSPLPIQFPRIQAERINLEPQRQAIQREENTARNVILRNSRDVSNPANAYANQIAGISGLTDSVGTQLGQSYMTEANANAQNRQSVAEKNAEISMQEEMQNAKLWQDYNNTTSGYINSLSETIPKAMRDYRSDYSQNMMMNIMGKDYGLYEPIPQFKNSWEKFMYNMRGPQYRVMNRQYANQNLGK